MWTRGRGAAHVQRPGRAPPWGQPSPQDRRGSLVIQCVPGKGRRQYMTGLQVRDVDCYGNAGAAEPRTSGVSAATPALSGIRV